MQTVENQLEVHQKEKDEAAAEGKTCRLTHTNHRCNIECRLLIEFKDGVYES